ncbi:rhomboid family intramembrane serine protease [Thermodesulfatator indicus]
MKPKLLFRGNKAEAKRYSLVLLARGIEHEIVPGGKWEIYVGEEAFLKAKEEIRLYEQENKTIIQNQAHNYYSAEAIFWTMAFLGVLNALLLFVEPKEKLLIIGAADNVKFSQGEWWRVFTSLTLHQDFGHLMGNLVFTGLFMFFLRPFLSLGLSWLMIILSGAIGNSWNLALHTERHISIGFSTASFGCLGIISVFLAFQKKSKRLLLAVGFALAFLGFLGSGGTNVDLGAHFLGLLAGVYLGVLWNLFLDKSCNYKFSLIGLVAGFSLLVLAWIWAFLNYSA